MINQVRDEVSGPKNWLETTQRKTSAVAEKEAFEKNLRNVPILVLSSNFSLFPSCVMFVKSLSEKTESLYTNNEGPFKLKKFGNS